MSKKLKNLSDDDVWIRWNERMKRARQDLHHVYGTRHRFMEITKLFEKNSDLAACGGDVYKWMFQMWARDIVIAIRRELDDDTNTVCLGRLLIEFSTRPKVITRRRFLGEIPENDFKYHMLSETFTSHGVIRPREDGRDSLDDYLDPQGISADRKKLLKTAKNVLAYANQLVAHRSETEEVPVTVGDVNRSVDEIEKVFIKYYAIICGPYVDGLTPSIIGDWMKPFTIAWITQDAWPFARPL